MKRSHGGLEDVPELIHHIQSRLPVNEVARTSILSKSWLRAWSTIPNLRFHVHKREKEHMKLKDVDHTLIRYLHNNIPIERFELEIHIKNQNSASLAEKWIRHVATKTCLKELSLTICPYGASLHLPDEILSGENLTKIMISVTTSRVPKPQPVWMTTTHRPKCVTSLRELHLSGVCVSEGVLHDIFSSCTFLEKIELILCSKGLNTIKVKNLPGLYQLRIDTLDRGSTALEISHVQSLRSLGCNVQMDRWCIQHSIRPLINDHSISLGSSVTELTLGGGMITDNMSLDMITNLGLPFLESLTLDMACWTLESFHFTCASIMRLSLLARPFSLVDVVHVNTPKLLYFSFFGLKMMPSFLFPDSTLEKIEFGMGLRIDLLDASFFVKMREALMLSSKCNVHITTYHYLSLLPSEIDIEDLRNGSRFLLL